MIFTNQLFEIRQLIKVEKKHNKICTSQSDNYETVKARYIQTRHV